MLDLLLEHQTESTGGRSARRVAEAIAEEDAAPDAEAYVRAGMPRSTLRRWRAAPNTVELSILTVAPEVEAELREDAGDERSRETYRDRLLDALQEELDFVPPGRGTPVLIASSRARCSLQEIVADEFPRMGVLSRLELPPEADIEEFGQLKLP